MKRVKKLNEAAANVNATTTSDLWVVQTSIGDNPYYIYTKKEDAQIERDRYWKEYYDYYRKVNKQMTDEEFADAYEITEKNVKVITLSDDIDNRVEEAVDNATDQGEEY